MVINIDNLDRDIALLIYKNKLYEDDNHQYALERALNEEGKSLNINLEYNINEACNITDKLNKEGEIATFSIFTDYDQKNYLIAHLKEGLDTYRKIILNYAKSKRLKLGYFINFSGGDCEIIK